MRIETTKMAAASRDTLSSYRDRGHGDGNRKGRRIGDRKRVVEQVEGEKASRTMAAGGAEACGIPKKTMPVLKFSRTAPMS